MAGAIWLFMEFASDVALAPAGPRSKKEASGRADAIVVLTGGKGRVETGLLLLKKGRANMLVLSGVNIDSDLDAIFQRALAHDAHERDEILLEKASRNTYENAVEVRRIMEERGLKAIILVTSWYHMKRALFIFRRMMPEGTRIEPVAARASRPDDIRRLDANNLTLQIPEFVKYGWYRIRFAIEGRFHAAAARYLPLYRSPKKDKGKE
ncbi:MAG: YdcF family protein [Deltaproteobacteria bacterium]|nr:YdcF family protein [Deltaproteobacteria bacterium]